MTTEASQIGYGFDVLRLKAHIVPPGSATLAYCGRTIDGRWRSRPSAIFCKACEILAARWTR